MRLSAAAMAVVLLAASRANAAGESAATPAPFATKGPSFALFATSSVGDGLRFNNPYRLATVLGSDAQSVSRTAAYADLGIGAVVGEPYGVRHGVALRWSIAIEGIRQSSLAPSYLLWKRWRWLAAYGRLGPSIVLNPATTWGVEGSGGVVWFVRGGVGVAAEIVGDVFYGAGTRDVGTPAYPIVSGQLGLTFTYEVLP